MTFVWLNIVIVKASWLMTLLYNVGNGHEWWLNWIYPFHFDVWLKSFCTMDAEFLANRLIKLAPDKICQWRSPKTPECPIFCHCMLNKLQNFSELQQRKMHYICIIYSHYIRKNVYKESSLFIWWTVRKSIGRVTNDRQMLNACC